MIKISDDETILREGKCPYCGYDWKEKEQLSKNIEKTTKDVNSLLGTAGKQMKDTIDEIREIFMKNVWSNAELLISELEKDVLLSSFMEFEESDIIEKHKYIEQFLKDNAFEINMSKENSVDSIEKDIQQIQDIIKETICILPEEYYQKKTQYQFDTILTDYFFSVNYYYKTVMIL